MLIDTGGRGRYCLEGGILVLECYMTHHAIIYFVWSLLCIYSVVFARDHNKRGKGQVITVEWDGRMQPMGRCVQCPLYPLYFPCHPWCLFCPLRPGMPASHGCTALDGPLILEQVVSKQHKLRPNRQRRGQRWTDIHDYNT